MNDPKCEQDLFSVLDHELSGAMYLLASLGSAHAAGPAGAAEYQSVSNVLDTSLTEMLDRVQHALGHACLGELANDRSLCAFEEAGTEGTWLRGHVATAPARN